MAIALSSTRSANDGLHVPDSTLDICSNKMARSCVHQAKQLVPCALLTGAWKEGFVGHSPLVGQQCVEPTATRQLPPIPNRVTDRMQPKADLITQHARNLRQLNNAHVFALARIEPANSHGRSTNFVRKLKLAETRGQSGIS